MQTLETIKNLLLATVVTIVGAVAVGIGISILAATLTAEIVIAICWVAGGVVVLRGGCALVFNSLNFKTEKSKESL